MTRLISVSLVFVVVGLFTLGGTSAAHAQRVVATVDSAQSVIDYTGSAPLHDWTGTSRDVSGRFVLDPDQPDSSRAVIRVLVASFDSGNDRRDRKMREVTEAKQYPLVEFRTTALQPVQWGRSTDGHAGKWKVRGELTFHGRTHLVETTADVRVTDGQVRVRAKFAISLTRFKVERPSLLWASIDDKIRLDARIVGTVEEPSSADRRSRNAQPSKSP
ncbi:MAG: YceI family protein [Salinibacter sp.]